MREEIEEILRVARDTRVSPGAVVGWIKNGERHVVASGRLTYEADAPLVAADTLYDVASVTKSIPLSSLVQIALQENVLQLSTKAHEILQELTGNYHELITVEHLLTYTAIWDMPEGISQFAKNGADALLQALYTVPLVAKPGETYCYTNAPALVLGLMLEKIYALPLNVIAQEKLFGPLHMSHTTFDPRALPDDQVAPTERIERGDVHKVVHDEAAKVLRKHGMVAGNAGVFSTASDILNYCEMVLRGGKTAEGVKLLSAMTIESFEHNYLSAIHQAASLGWELHQPRFMGNYAHAKMFGKTGFTGCVVLIDRARQTAMVLLANAQYPQRHTDKESVNQLRCDLANIVFRT